MHIANPHRPAGFLSVAAIAALTTVPAVASPVSKGLVVDHVTVVDPRTGEKTADLAIVIEDGRIVAMRPGGTVRVRGAARRIDQRGIYAVPGFNDMHAHNLNTADGLTSLPVMLAFGVTGFRQMSPPAALFAQGPDGRRTLPALSPRLLASPGTLLAGPAFATPEKVAAEVDRQKSAGVDFIKVVDLPHDAFLAAADEAQKLGLPFSGHLGPNVDAHEAIAHGMDAIEHLGPTISLLLSCSTDEAPVRNMLARVPPGAGGVDFDADIGKVQRMLANPVLAAPPQALLVTSRVIGTYDEAKCRKLASDLAASTTWAVPTLSRLEAMNLGNDPALRGNPALQYVPKASRQMWNEVGDEFEKKLSADQRSVLAKLFARQMHLAGLLDAAGAKLLAGTDFGGQWLVSGQSLHHEFDLLAKAGISPLHILQMTTINPAIYLGQTQTMGTIAAGKRADIVLLGGDPTASVANLHLVKGVIRDGAYHSRAELDRVLAESATKLAN